MKLGTYIRESWYNLLNDRVYSAVYIIGTGLALALVMAWLTVRSVHFQNSYPEVHRDRMLTLSTLAENNTDEEINSTAMLSAKFVDRFLKVPTEGLEAVSAFAFNEAAVSTAAGESMNAITCYVDDEYWQVFGFDFLEGRAFSLKDMSPSAPEAVISEQVAGWLFGHTDVVGESLFSEGKEYRISGVVRDVPMSATVAFSQVWMADVDRKVRDASISGFFGRDTWLGDYIAVFLAEDKASFGKIRKAVEERISAYNNARDSDYTLDVYKGIPSMRENIFLWSDMTSASYTWIGIAVMAFILLLPMINLSGMVGSRMEARMPEFGVRKAFGAWRGDVLGQIVGENLLLTLLGGVLGLGLCYIALSLFPEQFNSILPAQAIGADYAMDKVDATVFMVRDFFRPDLYLLLLALILVLNLVSAVIPAFKVLRRPITDSLNAIK